MLRLEPSCKGTSLTSSAIISDEPLSLISFSATFLLIHSVSVSFSSILKFRLCSSLSSMNISIPKPMALASTMTRGTHLGVFSRCEASHLASSKEVTDYTSKHRSHNLTVKRFIYTRKMHTGKSEFFQHINQGCEVVVEACQRRLI
jgi:hypothetical protein